MEIPGGERRRVITWRDLIYAGSIIFLAGGLYANTVSQGRQIDAIQTEIAAQRQELTDISIDRSGTFQRRDVASLEFTQLKEAVDKLTDKIDGASSRGTVKQSQ